MEKLAATRHTNGQDIWVLVHREDDEFAAYLVTDTGININPVISASGSDHEIGSAAIGQMKFSPDGSMIALVAGRHLDFLEIFSFDNSTGIVSNPIHVSTIEDGYGVEFSPDGTKLYISQEHRVGANSDLSNLYQLDISNLSPTAIAASRITLFTAQKFHICGALQLAPDGKIYSSVGGNYAGWLGVINEPNVSGVACGYNPEGIFLDGKRANIGLPGFISSYFENTLSLSNLCLGDTTQFSFTGTIKDSLKWNFGDPNSGINNQSTLNAPSHFYADTGNYTVTIISYQGGSVDTTTGHITISSMPAIELGEDRTICYGDSVTLYVSIPNASYSWQDSSTESYLIVTKQGKYWVDALRGSCKVTDTITITMDSCLTSIPNLQSINDNGFVIYPNPVHDILVIAIKSNHTTDFKLFNIFGKEVLSVELKDGTNRISTNNLASGVYIYNIPNNGNSDKIIIK